MLCENSLRITVGTPEENRILIEALRGFVKEKGTRNKK
jgi:histidinol-phosphate/aromatic aminotransferase/cobyric acid decarboxylase-like protein